MLSTLDGCVCAAGRNGFMRQRACWFYAQFAASIFRKARSASDGGDGGKGGPSPQAVAQMHQVFPLVVECLQDRGTWRGTTNRRLLREALREHAAHG